jgi:hypothetical protein
VRLKRVGYRESDDILTAFRAERAGRKNITPPKRSPEILPPKQSVNNQPPKPSVHKPFSKQPVDQSPPQPQIQNSYRKDTSDFNLKYYHRWDRYSEQQLKDMEARADFQSNEELMTAYTQWKSLHETSQSERRIDGARKQSVSNNSDSVSARAQMENLTDEQFVARLGFPDVRSYVESILTDAKSTYLEHRKIEKEPDSAIKRIKANQDMKHYCKEQAFIGLQALAAKAFRDVDTVAQRVYDRSVADYLEDCCAHLEDMRGMWEETKYTGEEKKPHERRMQRDKDYKANHDAHVETVREHNKEEQERYWRNMELIHKEFREWDVQYEVTRPRGFIPPKDKDGNVCPTPEEEG